MKSTGFSPEKKDKKKKIRSVIQGIILITILVIILKSIFSFSTYEPYDNLNISKNQDTGFIAVSYFGVDRIGDDTLISTDNLEKQLKALKDNGYVTITQQDIMDYYLNGKMLPEKSLFLMFEDGRKDTAVFSQKLMEKYNFKGSILTYADQFEKKDSQFLKPDDLKDLVNGGYWELSTAGYRLEYINVFDKEENYLGNLNSIDFWKLSKNLGGNYDYYLMDYIRDKDGIPLESYSEMKERIADDYNLMSQRYTEELGKIPDLYVLMRSNTGQFGTNKRVSDVNEKYINDLFKMNFNREGSALNTYENSIYDLTRTQPQPYWSTNHLLMRIYGDTNEKIEFVTGDMKKAESFEEISGAAEFNKDIIILTSEFKSNGMLKLLNSEGYKNIRLKTTLEGNIIGSQGIYLRSDDSQSNAVFVQISNNTLNVIEKINGKDNKLYSSKLDEREEFKIKDKESRKLEIVLNEDSISVYVDKKCFVKELKLSNVNNGSIYLEASCEEYEFSQKSIADDIYDGVFKGLEIEDINENILYDNNIKGIEKLASDIKEIFNATVNWFIKYL